MYISNITDELLILLKLFSKHVFGFIHAGKFYYRIDVFNLYLEEEFWFVPGKSVISTQTLLSYHKVGAH